MPFNINDFTQNINDYGTASSSKYDINISLPIALQDTSFSLITASMNDLIPFRADDVTTPGVALLTNDTNKWGIGPRIKQPYNAVLSPVTIRFIADSSGELEAFFNTWFNLGFNYSEDSSTVPTFNANYRSDVVSSQINIIKYDRTGNVINSYNLYNALPVMISPIRMGWDEQNQIIKFMVSFTYQSFTIT